MVKHTQYDDTNEYQEFDDNGMIDDSFNENDDFTEFLNKIGCKKENTICFALCLITYFIIESVKRFAEIVKDLHT